MLHYWTRITFGHATDSQFIGLPLQGQSDVIRYHFKIFRLSKPLECPGNIPVPFRIKFHLGMLIM